MGIHYRGDRRIGRLGWKLSSCWVAANPRCYSDIGTVKLGLGLKGWPALSSQFEKGRLILQSAQEILFFGNA
jgi:hypothetical protein